MNVWQPVDKFLDQITMYRLLRHVLADLLIAAFFLSFLGVLQYNPWEMFGATCILLAACFIWNKLFSLVFAVPASTDSYVITAFILALIITPSLDAANIIFLLAASGIAMASKYLLTIRRQHIFNPAALAVVATAYGAQQTASWWVGTPAMALLVIIGGVLVARKIRREWMIITFFAVTLAATAVLSQLADTGVAADLKHAVLSSPMLFLGFVMLTEPQTSPATTRMQIAYAALVGALLPPQVHLLNFYSSPELSLLIGNAFSYLVSPRKKLLLRLREKVQVAANSFDFVFEPLGNYVYQPGQYMEWTLPHHGVDKRGNRRYFTLASSPTEPELRVGVKFYDKGSSFKRALLDMNSKTPVMAGQLEGEFTLPQDPNQKLAFIAGGIGITPFRSMTKYLLDTNQKRDVTLLFAARSVADAAYVTLFEAARKKIGLKAIYVWSDGQRAKATATTYTGQQINAELISHEITDYQERIFYISGTHTMVESIKDALLSLDIPSSQIKTDFFPGYA